ncbi:MAG TPA: YceI family protein [Caulobacteraceae bacterium]|jgi:polyisoprenoid-binding protein YceI|nr:YceI family protein [Caulobacteraceae bacterium]
MKTLLAPVGALMFAASISGSALAQPAPTPPSTDPSKVESGSYKAGSPHTRIVFTVRHMGFTDYYGQFNGINGELKLDAANPSNSALTITIPTDSVDANNTVLTGELKSAQWFDAAKYPTITFKSTKVVRTGKDTAQVTGDLTFHGVTHPVTLDAKFNAGGLHPFTKKYTVGFNATGHLKRSDFDEKTYIPLIGDDVGLMISAEFEKVS